MFRSIWGTTHVIYSIASAWKICFYYTRFLNRIYEIFFQFVGSMIYIRRHRCKLISNQRLLDYIFVSFWTSEREKYFLVDWEREWGWSGYEEFFHWLGEAERWRGSEREKETDRTFLIFGQINQLILLCIS